MCIDVSLLCASIGAIAVIVGLALEEVGEKASALFEKTGVCLVVLSSVALLIGGGS